MTYKIQAELLGLHSIYYVIYKKRWWGGWEDLGGRFESVEEAEKALQILGYSKIIEIMEGGDTNGHTKEGR
jgi:hypothetical protein